jgi:hypothetical protein
MEESDAVELLLKSAAEDSTQQNKQIALEIVKVSGSLGAFELAGSILISSRSYHIYLLPSFRPGHSSQNQEYSKVI